MEDDNIGKPDEVRKPDEGVDVSAKQLNQSKTVGKRVKRAMAVIGIPFAVGAWVAFFFSPFVAMVLACIGLGFSAVGVGSGKGCLRDLAITFVITSFIVIIVYSLFNWGVPYAIDSL